VSGFLRACISTDWDEAKSMIDGMLAEPWHLRGYQEKRLHDFLGLLPAGRAIERTYPSRLSPQGEQRHHGRHELTPHTDRRRLAAHLAMVEKLGKRLWLGCDACQHTVMIAPRRSVCPRHCTRRC
jgi:hypothetical protein